MKTMKLLGGGVEHDPSTQENEGTFSYGLTLDNLHARALDLVEQLDRQKPLISALQMEHRVSLSHTT